MATLNGIAGHRDDGVPAVQDRRLRHARAPTTTTRSAGRRRFARRISGPSRSPRTGAAPATARSCTGRTAFDGQGRDAQSVPSRHRRRADDLEAAGLPAPTVVNGIQQAPLEGISMLSTLAKRDAPETPRPCSTSRYSAIAASTTTAGRRSPNTARRGWPTHCPPLDDDVWELYGPDDWSQAHNLAAENPEKLAELQRLWLIEAVKYNVLPLDDRPFERFNADIAGRPQLIKGNTQTAVRRDARSENCVVNIKNKSHSVTAEARRCPNAAPTGVIVTQGGGVGGWTPVRERGQAEVLLQLLRHRVLLRHGRRAHPSRRSRGADGVRLRRRRARQGRKRHAATTTERRSAVDESSRPSRWPSRQTKPATSAPTPARRRHPTTALMATSSPARSTGCIIDIGEDSHDHLVTAEDKFNISMSRQ